MPKAIFDLNCPLADVSALLPPTAEPQGGGLSIDGYTCLALTDGGVRVEVTAEDAALSQMKADGRYAFVADVAKSVV